jgi:hypothetical protein
MPSERVMVEMGGIRERCTMVGQPKWSAKEGGMVGRARRRGKEFAIVDVCGVWLTRPAWEHVKKVLGRRRPKKPST